MSDQVLAIKNRPNSFAEMVGQSDICESVIKFAPKARMWGFFGGPGAGKTTLARICALSYQDKGFENFGTPSERTLARESSFAIHYMNGGVVGKVENMRNLLDTVDYVPDEPSRKRVVIIDEAHRLSSEAQEALLIPTENVPKHLVWIFCTSDHSKLKEALLRRMVRVTMNTMSDEDRVKLTARLAKAMGFKKDTTPFVTYANGMGVACAGVLTSAFEQWAEGTALKGAFIEALSMVEAYSVVRSMKKGNWVGCRSTLAAMGDESLKQLRYLITHILRQDLVKSTQPQTEARAIEIMCPVVAYEEKVASAEIAARIYRVCQVYAKK